jgi:2-C-methyl-D-erythritol 4-phosphate cytidylyltransferase
MTTDLILLAAGRGDRLQSGENKVFAPLGDEPLIVRTAKAFACVPELQETILVVRPEDEVELRRRCGPRLPRSRWVHGGTTRRDSSLAGVRASTADWVLIHDAARPFPSHALIRRVMEAVKDHDAAIPVTPLTDLLHRTDGSRLLPLVSEIVGTGSLVRAQTPQGFRRELILACLEQAGPEIRDDASAVVHTGRPVVAVAGDPCNIKVTYPEDLLLARGLLVAEERS